MVEQDEMKRSSKKEEKSEGKSVKKIIITLVVVAILLIVYFFVNSYLNVLNRKLTAELNPESTKQQKNDSINDLQGNGNSQLATDEGRYTNGTQGLPKDFPVDVPIYKNTKIISSSTNQKDYMVILTSFDLLSQVSDFYNRELKNNGWTMESKTEIANATIFSIKKGNRTGGVIINTKDEGVQITLEVSETK